MRFSFQCSPFNLPCAEANQDHQHQKRENTRPDVSRKDAAEDFHAQGLSVGRRAVPVDRDEQEQPDHVNEVPVPCGSFEPKMAVGRKMALGRAPPTDSQEKWYQ